MRRDLSQHRDALPAPPPRGAHHRKHARLAVVAHPFRGEGCAVSNALLARVSHEGAVVPSLWRLEVANSLQTGIKRKRIDAAYRDSSIQIFLRLPIEIDLETNDYAWTTILQLADMHQLTVYDAAYLELALRRSLPLATRDEDLAAAAGGAGVVLLPSR